jgi:hypothetical protein
LLSNIRRDTHTDTQTVGSTPFRWAQVPIYIPSFINIGSEIQKLIGEGDTQTDREHADLIGLLSFFKIRKVG